MTEIIKRAVRSSLGNSPLYKYLRSKFVFNSLASPRPLMVPTEPLKIDWYQALSNKPVDDHEVSLAYLISPMQRSGTNYLHYILSLHSDISTLPEDEWPPEDFILSNAQYLEQYVTNTLHLWHYWIKDENLLNNKAGELLANMGAGLAKMFEPKNSKLTLLKTPDSLGIESFFKLFPTAKIIILTRDGRDTIESYMNSWGGRGNFNSLAKRWNDRVNKIITFKNKAEKYGMEHQVLMVDYDKLNRSTKNIVRDILQFLELAPSKYDWDSMSNIPVLGSSVLRGENHKVNWEPIAKPKNFNQEPKWKNWTTGERRRFKKYAGKALIDLGYEVNSNW